MSKNVKDKENFQKCGKQDNDTKHKSVSHLFYEEYNLDIEQVQQMSSPVKYVLSCYIKKYKVTLWKVITYITK